MQSEVTIMSSLVDFALNEEYKRLESAGDKLAEIESRIDWKPFSSMLGSMYGNETDPEDMPEADSIAMLKMLVLQQWYDISDNELEKQCIDRISFRRFLGFPAYIPDSETVSSFRDRLNDNNLEEEIWDELQKQLDALGVNIKNGTMEDATFTYSTSGHEKADRTKKYVPKTIEEITGITREELIKLTLIAALSAMTIKLMILE